MDNEITLNVDGQTTTVDIESMVAIFDLSEDMSTVASNMAWLGSLWAAAREERERAENIYRAWRARASKEVLEDDPKMAEWKVKLAIESDPDFLDHKAAMREAQRVVDRLSTALDAVSTKADMLRSKGANARAELDATSLATRRTNTATRGASVEDDDPDDVKPSKEERAAMVRATLKQRRRAAADSNADDDE